MAMGMKAIRKLMASSVEWQAWELQGAGQSKTNGRMYLLDAHRKLRRHFLTAGSPSSKLAAAKRGCYFCSMSSVLEIESAIEKLPTAQMLEIAAWLDEQRAMIQTSEGMFAALDAEEGTQAGRQWTGE